MFVICVKDLFVSVGDNDGSVGGNRYFRVPPKHGICVLVENVISVYNLKVGTVVKVMNVRSHSAF